jgi:hypothetical protein
MSSNDQFDSELDESRFDQPEGRGDPRTGFEATQRRERRAIRERTQILEENPELDEEDVVIEETDGVLAPTITDEGREKIAIGQIAEENESLREEDIAGVKETEEGFEPVLTEEAQVERVTEAIAEETPDLDVPDIAEVEETDEGFQAILSDEAREERLIQQIAEQSDDLSPEDIADIEQTDGGIRPVLTDEARTEIEQQEFAEVADELYSDVDIRSEDVERTESGFELSDEAVSEIQGDVQEEREEVAEQIARLQDDFPLPPAGVDGAPDPISSPTGTPVDGQIPDELRPDDFQSQTDVVGREVPSESDIQERVQDEFDAADIDRDISTGEEQQTFGDDIPIPGRDFEVPDELRREIKRVKAAERANEEIEGVDVDRDDIIIEDGGARLPDELQRRGAAQQLDEEVDEIDVSPEDIEETDDGFDLSEEAQREVAAQQLDEEVDEIDVSSEDIKETDDGYSLSGETQREIASQQLDEDVEGVDVSPGDVEKTEEGFTLSQEAQEEQAIQTITEERDDLSPEDIESVRTLSPSEQVSQTAEDGRINIGDIQGDAPQADEAVIVPELTDEAQRERALEQITADEDVDHEDIESIEIEDGSVDVQFSEAFREERAAERFVASREGVSREDIASVDLESAGERVTDAAVDRGTLNIGALRASELPAAGERFDVEFTDEFRAEQAEADIEAEPDIADATVRTPGEELQERDIASDGTVNIQQARRARLPREGELSVDVRLTEEARRERIIDEVVSSTDAEREDIESVDVSGARADIEFTEEFQQEQREQLADALSTELGRQQLQILSGAAGGSIAAGQRTDAADEVGSVVDLGPEDINLKQAELTDEAQNELLAQAFKYRTHDDLQRRVDFVVEEAPEEFHELAASLGYDIADRRIRRVEQPNIANQDFDVSTLGAGSETISPEATPQSDNLLPSRDPISTLAGFEETTADLIPTPIGSTAQRTAAVTGDVIGGVSGTIGEFSSPLVKASAGASETVVTRIGEPAAGFFADAATKGVLLKGVETATDTDISPDYPRKDVANRFIENALIGGGRVATDFTVGLPATTAKGANLTGDVLEFTAEEIESEGFAEGTASTAATAGLIGGVVAKAGVEAFTENPVEVSGKAVGSGLAGYGIGAATGRGLGIAARGLRQRLRTVGGKEVDASDSAKQKVVERKEQFPSADEPELYKTVPATAVRQQAKKNTPEEIQAAFEAQGVEGVTLKKGLDVEPIGPARKRAAQGFKSTPDETGIDPETITWEMVVPRKDGPGPFDYEQPGSSVSPEISPYFTKIEETKPKFSYRPGLPDLGSSPTFVFLRTNVEAPEAQSQLKFAKELAEHEGETSALTKPVGSKDLNPGEIEAVLPPGAEFADVGTGVVRDLLRRVGIGSDFYTVIDDQRVSLRTVADPDELPEGQGISIRSFLDDVRGQAGGRVGGGSRVIRSIDRRSDFQRPVYRPFPTVPATKPASSILSDSATTQLELDDRTVGLIESEIPSPSRDKFQGQFDRGETAVSIGASATDFETGKTLSGVSFAEGRGQDSVVGVDGGGGYDGGGFDGESTIGGGVYDGGGYDGGGYDGGGYDGGGFDGGGSSGGGYDGGGQFGGGTEDGKTTKVPFPEPETESETFNVGVESEVAKRFGGGVATAVSVFEADDPEDIEFDDSFIEAVDDDDTPEVVDATGDIPDSLEDEFNL